MAVNFDRCINVNGELIPIRFTRRRYNRVTFCYAQALINGDWVSLGDPWPAVNWKLAELTEAVQLRVAEAEAAR